MVAYVAARLVPAIDPAALWHDWLGGGLPSATRLAGVCFARAEEPRWRAQSAQRSSPPPLLSESEAAAGAGATGGETLSAPDRTYLAELGSASGRESVCPDG